MRSFLWNPFLRFPRVSLGLSLLLCVPLLWRGGGFRVSSETRVLLEGDSRNLATYEKVESILGDTEVVVVNLHHEDLFSPEGLDSVRRISAAFAREPGVWDVKSLTHSSKPVRRGLSFDMVPFVPAGPLSDAERAQLKAFCLEHPLVRNVMVSADGKNSLITVTYRGRVSGAADEQALTDRVEAVLAPFRAAGMELWVVGLPLAAEEIRATLRADLARLLPVGLAWLAVILWLTFRSWRVLVLVVLQQGVALALMPGLIAWSGFRLSLFSALVLPLLGGVQLTWLAHLFSALRRGFERTGEPDPALRWMLGEVLKPSIFAAVTTLAGMVSLTFAEVEPVRDFGRLGVLGLGFIFLLTFGPGLACLRLVVGRWPTGWANRTGDAGDEANWADRWTWRVARHRKLVLGTAMLLLAGGAWAGRFIRTDIRAVEFLSPDSPTRQAMVALDRAYGGINVVQIEFDTGRTNGLNDLSFLKYLEGIHEFAAAQPEPSGVYSYASLLAMMNQIWEEERPGSLKLPESPFVLGLFVLALRSYDYPFLTALADEDQRVAQLVIRTPDLPAAEYLAMIDRVVEHAALTAPEGVAVSAAAGLHSILEADRRILRSQTWSLWLTLTSIGLVLTLLWRSAGLALLVLGVNLLPLCLASVAAVFWFIPLNSVTVMVAAVALGLAVDDAIHLVTAWRDHSRAGVPSRVALGRALHAKARPILWTSVILVSTFGLLGFASFPPVTHFGLLAALTLAGALLAVLVVLPAGLTGMPERSGIAAASSAPGQDEDGG